MSRAKRLAQRRALLVLECTLQRTTLIAQSRALGQATGWIKSSDGLIKRLKNMPGWASAALAGLLVIMPGRAISVARNGLMIWQLWRSISSVIDKKETP